MEPHTNAETRGHDLSAVRTEIRVEPGSKEKSERKFLIQEKLEKHMQKPLVPGLVGLGLAVELDFSVEAMFAMGVEGAADIIVDWTGLSLVRCLRWNG